MIVIRDKAWNFETTGIPVNLRTGKYLKSTTLGAKYTDFPDTYLCCYIGYTKMTTTSVTIECYKIKVWPQFVFK